MERIRNVLALLRGQLWIVPALMSAAALALAYAMLGSGLAYLAPRGTDLWWLYGGDAGTARNLLSALLSGLMTMTSLVVSVTFIILTLASSQLGPRLVWNFIGDRQIQAVLGLFLGTTLYIIVVLRSLDDTLGPQGVPHLAITAGSALTAVCLFALLFYVHKIARSIIADTVVEQVAGELRASIHDLRLHSEDDSGLAGCAAPHAVALPPQVGSVSLSRAGYIQTIDYGALVAVAHQHDVVLRVLVRAGHFVLSRGEHVAAYGAAGALDNAAAETIRAAFVIGSERSPAQDLEFAVRQLVEIALRALSPSINDPFTAVTVIDRLGAALEEIFGRALPPAALQDEAGRARVIVSRTDADGLVDACFDQIRQAASEHPAVLIHIGDLFGKLAPVLTNEDARGPILRHLQKLAETAKQRIAVPSDRETTLARIDQARIKVDQWPRGD
jgi:uncharacterized membrane protein